MAREVRIGCVQTRPLATFDEAIEEARGLAGRAVADGAELVCLPEYCGGLKSENGLFAPPTAPEARHPVLDALRGFASDNRAWTLIRLHCGRRSRRPVRQPRLRHRRPGRHPGPATTRSSCSTWTSRPRSSTASPPSSPPAITPWWWIPPGADSG